MHTHSWLISGLSSASSGGGSQARTARRLRVSVGCWGQARVNRQHRSATSLYLMPAWPMEKRRGCRRAAGSGTTRHHMPEQLLEPVGAHIDLHQRARSAKQHATLVVRRQQRARTDHVRQGRRPIYVRVPCPVSPSIHSHPLSIRSRCYRADNPQASSCAPSASIHWPLPRNVDTIA